MKRFGCIFLGKRSDKNYVLRRHSTLAGINVGVDEEEQVLLPTAESIQRKLL